MVISCLYQARREAGRLFGRCKRSSLSYYCTRGMEPPMDEPALLFGNAELSAQKEAVRVFYKEMWDHADKSLIPTIFHPGFTFRGSLGPSLVGFDEFAGYVDWVT